MTRSHAVSLTCFLAMLVLNPQVALGQSSDKTAVALAAARMKYESELDSIRSQVQAALDKALEAVPKADDAEAAHKATKAAIEAFRSRGELPDDKLKPQWEQRYARAAKEMTQAYFRAGAAYAKDSKPEIEQVLDAERTCLNTLWDLVPWEPRFTAKDKPEAERTIAADSEPLAVRTEPWSNYAIDIRAKRAGTSGSLIVDVPLPDGKILEVPAHASSAGEVRFLGLVRDGKCFVSHGASRPIDLAKSRNGEGGELKLRADGGPLIIESVRIKPIVDGEPPEQQGVVKPPGKDKAPPQSAAGLMPKGSVWRGQVRHSTRGTFDTRLEVVNVTDNSIVTHCSWVGEVKLEFVFSYTGKKLRVSGVRELSKTGGTRAGADGTGSVSERSLNTSFSWRVSGGNLQNQSISGTMSLTKQ